VPAGCPQSGGAFIACNGSGQVSCCGMKQFRPARPAAVKKAAAAFIVFSTLFFEILFC